MINSWKKGLATAIALGCFGMLATPLTRAQSTPTATPTPTPHVYPEEAANDILENCRQESGKFLPPELVEPLCECVVTEIKVEYDYEQYQTITGEAEKQGEDPPEFTEIGEQCAVELF